MGGSGSDRFAGSMQNIPSQSTSMRASPTLAHTSSSSTATPSLDSTTKAATTGTSQSTMPMLADPFQHDASTSQDSSTSDDVVVGQFSFAPAIKKTVVTTTTTTTTHFPPLVMNAPKQLHDLDPKLYPLAASPTPPSMKELHFSLGGRPTVFCEAEDGYQALDTYRQQQKRLKSSHGVTKTLETNESEYLDNQHSDTRAFAGTRRPRSPPLSSSFQPVDFTPPSISLSRTRSSQKALGKQRRMPSRQPSLSQKDFPRPQRSSSKLQIMQTSTPVTPFASGRSVDVMNDDTSAGASRAISATSPARGTPSGEQGGREVAQTLSPQPESSLDRAQEDNGIEEMAPPEPFINTPPVESHSNSTSRPRPAALNTASTQDASLPSPSLSPVTAAANMHSRSYFDDSLRDHRSDSQTDKHLRRRPAGLGLWQDDEPDHHNLVDGEYDDAGGARFSMMDLPDMVDAFDAMPTDMKSYMMYQLLRRCPKPSLRFIADVVNPALKCDFLGLLPPELSQLIIGNLDLKSLCRASQVSRKWRQVIDNDEKIWKDLFDNEGFTLAPGELRRAILEGWGWQLLASIEDYERNLGNLERSSDGGLNPVDSLLRSSPGSDGTASSLVESRRTKRKANARLRAASRKVQKRRDTFSSEIASFDMAALERHIRNAEGPFKAAQVAKLAVPNPEVGLPGLRAMNLHKSVYRRHHLIGQNWMQDRVKPRHIAFGAHGGHVVTCLEFDSDKIITGSDDQKINVYDTRTGALRATLEGHDGGVWALKYEGNILVSGSTDRSVRVWDIERGVCVHVFQGHTSTVRCLLIIMPTVVGRSSDGRPITMPKEPLIVTGSRDSTLRVWRLPKPGDAPTFDPSERAHPATTTATGAVAPDDDEQQRQSLYWVRTLAGHTHSVRAIAAHGDTLVSGSYDYTVRVWRISTGETVHRLTGHTQKVYSVVLDHERRRCISGSMDNLVKIWSLESGQCLFNLDGHSSLVGLLDLQRDRLVSAAADFTLRIWDPANGQCKAVLSAHTGAITCFQHDAHKVISGSDRNLKMWNVRTGEFVRDLLTDLTGVWQVKFDEHRCVAAVQRDSMTYLEILDFSAARDGMAAGHRGRRIVVNTAGEEIIDAVAVAPALPDAEVVA